MISVILYSSGKWKQSLSLGEKVIKSVKNRCFLMHVKFFLFLLAQTCKEVASYLFRNQILVGNKFLSPLFPKLHNSAWSRGQLMITFMLLHSSSRKIIQYSWIFTQHCGIACRNCTFLKSRGQIYSVVYFVHVTYDVYTPC